MYRPALLFFTQLVDPFIPVPPILGSYFLHLVAVGPKVTVRHSVMFKLIPEVTDTQVEGMVEALKGMPYKIPQMASIVCGRDKGLAAQGNHDFALTVDLADAEGYQVYAAHPEHQRVIAEYIKPIILPGSRVAVQFGLPQSSL